jgi:peptidoglycan/LPS O-acetylase OafA/YrhL
MGLLRIFLALAVVAAHVGPLLGLRFFGGGVMAVETFYMLSGFYMALVLTTRYRGRTRDFYFNRFLRLFPVYWMLTLASFALAGLYWLVVGHPVGVLVAWHLSANPGQWLWAGLSNLGIVGSDWAELYSFLHTVDGNGVNRLIAIEPVWTLAIEITFYLAAPFILRLRYAAQAAVFLATLFLRLAIWRATGNHWTVWLYYFAPATWVFFLAGVQAYHLLVWLKRQREFARVASPLGRTLCVLLLLLIAFYAQAGILEFQDWRYYTAVGLSLPFIFTAFQKSAFDASLAGWSYPLYLAHWVIVSLWSPFRHVVPASGVGPVVLVLALLLCWAVMRVDDKIQYRYKHQV